MSLIQYIYADLIRFRMVNPGDTVVVGVSGGADSVALLHLLHRLQDRCQISLQVAHLNHMFRGTEAGADAALVERLASALDLPVTAERIDVPAYCSRFGLSPQAGARSVRYDFFSRVAAATGATRVALGHHADDQAETILLNFLRGTGTGGLGGIRPVRDNFYIRPLLGVRRREIEAYCRRHGLAYCQDTSNFKPTYTRNRVRLHLLPVLENQYNPSVVEALVRLSQICRDEDALLEEQARRIHDGLRIAAAGPVVVLEREQFLAQPPAIQRRVLRQAWQQVAGKHQDLTYQHVEDLLELLGVGVTGAEVVLPGLIKARAGYGTIEFYRPGSGYQVPAYAYPLQMPGETMVPELGLSIAATLLPAQEVGDPTALPPEVAALDYDRLPGPLTVRRRVPGDVFRPLGLGGTMKLKKFLNNQKIPAQQRDGIPLVVSGQNLVWVAGIRPAEDYKLSADTHRCLLLELKGLDRGGFVENII